MGQKILFQKYAGTEFKLDDEELLILSQKDVLAIVEYVNDRLIGSHLRRIEPPWRSSSCLTRRRAASLKRGVDKMADAVKVTIGPAGRYAILDKKFGSPTITNDGVTIARDIELEDPFENMGAQLLEEVATKTNDVAGDGTTTSIVLAQAIITEGLRTSPPAPTRMALKKRHRAGRGAIVEEIKRLSKPVRPRTTSRTSRPSRPATRRSAR